MQVSTACEESASRSHSLTGKGFHTELLNRRFLAAILIGSIPHTTAFFCRQVEVVQLERASHLFLGFSPHVVDTAKFNFISQPQERGHVRHVTYRTRAMH